MCSVHVFSPLYISRKAMDFASLEKNTPETDPEGFRCWRNPKKAIRPTSQPYNPEFKTRNIASATGQQVYTIISMKSATRTCDMHAFSIIIYPDHIQHKREIISKHICIRNDLMAYSSAGVSTLKLLYFKSKSRKLKWQLVTLWIRDLNATIEQEYTIVYAARVDMKCACMRTLMRDTRFVMLRHLVWWLSRRHDGW